MFFLCLAGCGDIVRLSDFGNHARSCPCKPQTALDPKVIRWLWSNSFLFIFALVTTQLSFTQSHWKLILHCILKGAPKLIIAEIRHHPTCQNTRWYINKQFCKNLSEKTKNHLLPIAFFDWGLTKGLGLVKLAVRSPYYSEHHWMLPLYSSVLQVLSPSINLTG